MKPALLLIFLFLCIIKSYSKPLVINGHVKHSDSLTLFEFKGPADFVEYNEKKMKLQVTRPDDRGFFRFNVDIQSGHYFFVKSNEDNLFNPRYFLPGDSVFIEVSDSEIEFNGSGAHAINYNPDSYYAPFLKNKMSRDSFYHYVDSLNVSETRYVRDMVDKNHLPESLYDNDKIAIDYKCLVQKVNYHAMHSFATGKKYTPFPDNYFSFINKSILNNERAHNNDYYYQLVNYYLIDLEYMNWEKLSTGAKKVNENKRDKVNLEADVHFIDSLFTGTSREIAYGRRLNDLIRNAKDHDTPDKKILHLHWADSLLQNIKPDANHLEGSIYAALKETRDRVGSILNLEAPGFTLNDLNDKQFSLSDFKGKVVLLDFWATSCRPCITSIPLSNKLQEDLSGKPFVSLNICCYSYSKDWKRVVEKFRWKGVNLFSPSTTICDTYNFTAYPHYVLIDKKGIVRSTSISNYDEDLKEQVLKLVNE
jgi:thiol-disulfide isomerase/thioredoxin